MPNQRHTSSKAKTKAAARRSGSRLTVWLLAGVLMLTGFGIWLLVRHTQLNRIDRAALSSLNALEEAVGSLPKLQRMLNNLETLSCDRSGTISLSLDSVADDGRHRGLAAEGSLDLDRELGSLALTLTMDDALAAPVDLQIGFDADTLQFGSDALLGDAQYRLPLRDLGRQWNDSVLAQELGQTLPEDLSLDLFSAREPEELMSDAFGDDWDSFIRSVKIVRLEGESRFPVGDQTVYTVEWDRESLARMYLQAALRTYGAARSSLSGGLDLLSGSGTADELIVVLGNADKNGTPPQFRVDREGRLTGLYYETENTVADLRLEGEVNPWDRIVISVQEDGETLGGELLLSVADDRLRLDAVFDGETANVLDYDDASGTLRLTLPGAEQPDLFGPDSSLFLRPDGESLSLSCTLARQNGATTTVRAKLGPVDGLSEVVSEEAEELLSMDKAQLRNLIRRLIMQIQIALNGGE